MIKLSPFSYFLILGGIMAAAFLVFSRVRRDYRAYGKLTPVVAVLQTGFFVLYALCSYVFLDSRLGQIKTSGLLFPLACGLMAVGFLVVILSMPMLGKPSFGGEVGKLRTDGLYRYSRNPQLVGGFLFMVGYVLLWPAWQGFLWAGLWLVIAPLMVWGEEEHLARIYGKEYLDYCARVSRYIGMTRIR